MTVQERFKVGDGIVVTSTGDGNLKIGMRGTVVDANPAGICLRFKGWTGGHEGNTTTDSKEHWWVYDGYDGEIDFDESYKVQQILTKYHSS